MIDHVINYNSITNREYQKLTGISRRTATTDLVDLVEKGIFKRIGKGKRDVKYVLLHKTAQ
jgi:ATP-dependent DNA helicase RecG